MFQHNNKGFTLVELSIVLVIIGLLIGGILAAQSMISTSKIQALIRQTGQFDATVENFQTKYQQLPGDTNLLGTVKGNNDGTVDGYNYVGEYAKFWADLSVSGFTNAAGGTYIDSSPGSDIMVTTNQKSPLAAAGNRAYVFVYGAASLNKNYYIMANPYQGDPGNALIVNPAYKTVDALAIDQKVDDGVANTGNVYSSDSNTVYGDLAPTTSQTCTTQPNNGIYNLANTVFGCSVAIRMGTSTGNLK